MMCVLEAKVAVLFVTPGLLFMPLLLGIHAAEAWGTTSCPALERLTGMGSGGQKRPWSAAAKGVTAREFDEGSTQHGYSPKGIISQRYHFQRYHNPKVFQSQRYHNTGAYTFVIPLGESPTQHRGTPHTANTQRHRGNRGGTLPSCRDCGGSGICQHGRVRGSCKDCGIFIALALATRRAIFD